MSPSANHRTPIEVWIKPFQRFAGSQGSALSRSPQRAKFPFETRCPPRFQFKQTKRKDRPFGRSFQEIARHTPFTHARRENKDSGLRAAGRAFLRLLVDSGLSRNQKGIPHPAGCGSGLCPENRQPLKRLAKLLFRPRGGIGSVLNPEMPDRSAYAPQYKPESPLRCPQSPASYY